MNTFLNLIKRVPWWGWIVAIVFVLLVWQQMSNWALSRKYYNMLLDNLRTDQSQIIKDKNAWIKQCEDEILKINTEKDKITKEKAIAQQDANNSRVEVIRLKGENRDLQAKLDSVVVSNDPDLIIGDLKKRFPSINRIKP